MGDNMIQTHSGEGATCAGGRHKPCWRVGHWGRVAREMVDFRHIWGPGRGALGCGAVRCATASLHVRRLSAVASPLPPARRASKCRASPWPCLLPVPLLLSPPLSLPPCHLLFFLVLLSFSCLHGSPPLPDFLAPRPLFSSVPYVLQFALRASWPPSLVALPRPALWPWRGLRLMDSLLDGGRPVLEQVLSPCPSLLRHALRLRSFVPGEFQDEDGDTATQFILADPPPSPSASHPALPVASQDWNDSNVLYLSDDDDDAAAAAADDDDDASFFCILCQQKMPLQSVILLTCPCLFCGPCLRAHAEAVLVKKATQIGLSAGPSHDCHRMDEVAGTSGNHPSEKERPITLIVDDSSREPLDSIPCPTAECIGRCPLSLAQQLAPEAFRMWEEAANEAFFTDNAAFVKCPGCKVVFEKVMGVLPPGVALTGVPELDRTAPFIELDNEGRRLSRSAMCHKATNRFRCRMCSTDFCGACMEFPYHLGRSCEEVAEEKIAAKCLFCEALLRDTRRWSDDKDLNLRSVKELQSQLEREDVDSAWCVEKGDLVAVHRFVAGVCDAKDCRKRARLSCTRSLECGHHCGGVRGERLCLPCLEEECRKSSSKQLGREFLPAATDLCGICLVEPLQRAPSIRLQCGHVVHLHCAKQKLLQGYPGPAISFGYLNCPQCPTPMRHVSLDADLRKHLELMKLVGDKAIKRLTMEGLLKTAKELQSGGSFVGRLSEYALYVYQFYMCSKCHVPYCGGKRDCVRIERDGENGAHNPLDLVCGGCSAAACGQGVCTRGHGKEYIEFKCAYCCSPATYFCFGRTHFCDNCHNSRPDMVKNLVLPKCLGPERCPLRVPHLPNGQECCLGCSMCRFTGQ